MAIDLAVESAEILIIQFQNVPTIDTIVYSRDADDSSLVGTNIFKDSIGADELSLSVADGCSHPGDALCVIARCCG